MPIAEVRCKNSSKNRFVVLVFHSSVLTQCLLGFHLQCSDCAPFPVNAKTVHYLVSHNYIELPDLTTDEIWDKSKADSFAKGAVLFQGAWLVIQSIAREAQGLPITPLELFTLAFVVSTVMSYFFWWRKPQNVTTNTTLMCDYSTARIRADAGFPSGGWEHTPLDWIEMEGRRWTRRKSFSHFGLGTAQEPAKDEESHHSQLHDKATSPASTIATEPGQSRQPVQRIANDAILPSVLSPKVYAGLVIPSMIHSCIHLLGWNMDYPSNAEKQLWRASTVALAVMSCIAVGVVRMLAIIGYRGRYNLVFVWVNTESCQSGTETRKPQGGRGRRCFASVAAFAKALTAAEIFLTLATLTLVLARLYIIVEVIISLRSQPEGVYLALEWLDFLPHV